MGECRCSSFADLWSQAVVLEWAVDKHLLDLKTLSKEEQQVKYQSYMYMDQCILFYTDGNITSLHWECASVNNPMQVHIAHFTGFIF